MTFWKGWRSSGLVGLSLGSPKEALCPKNIHFLLYLFFLCFLELCFNSSLEGLKSVQRRRCAISQIFRAVPLTAFAADLTFQNAPVWTRAEWIFIRLVKYSIIIGPRSYYVDASGLPFKFLLYYKIRRENRRWLLLAADRPSSSSGVLCSQGYSLFYYNFTQTYFRRWKIPN